MSSAVHRVNWQNDVPDRLKTPDKVPPFAHRPWSVPDAFCLAWFWIACDDTSAVRSRLDAVGCQWMTDLRSGMAPSRSHITEGNTQHRVCGLDTACNRACDF